MQETFKLINDFWTEFEGIKKQFLMSVALMVLSV